MEKSLEVCVVESGSAIGQRMMALVGALALARIKLSGGVVLRGSKDSGSPLLGRVKNR